MVRPPFPLVDIAVEPRSEGDHKELGIALALLVSEDPRFSVYEAGQLVLHGEDEWRLEETLDFLIRDRGIGLNVGTAQVGYRESISRRAEIDYTHKKQTGDTGRRFNANGRGGRGAGNRRADATQSRQGSVPPLRQRGERLS